MVYNVALHLRKCGKDPGHRIMSPSCFWSRETLWDTMEYPETNSQYLTILQWEMAGLAIKF